MKLSRVTVLLADLRLRVPFTTSFGTAREVQRPFVLLETTDGRRGLGEVPTLPEPAYKPEVDTPAVLTSLERWLLPSLARTQREQGEIADVAALRDTYDWVKGAVFAKSGIEAAFWDVLAQEQDAPLWRCWGGSQRTFDVGVSIGGTTLADVLQLADRAAEQGFRRLKVKIWPGFDYEPAAALRHRFPDLLLQVDANSAYDRSNWRRLQALDDLDLLLIEQPLYDDDIYRHAQISRDLATPICLDESIHSRRDAETAIDLWRERAGVSKLIVNIKPPRVGGFAEAIVIAETCRAAGVRTWIGGMLDSAWGKAMNLQLNGLTSIDLPGDHFSPGGAYFEEDVTAGPLIATGGSFSLGNAPSAGVTVDWERLARLAPPSLSVSLVT